MIKEDFVVSKAEREILEVLLEKGPMTVRELAEAVSDHNWKKQTLNTFLLRLIAKGKVIRTYDSMREKNVYTGVPYTNFERLFEEKSEEQVAKTLMDMQQNMFFKSEQDCLSWLQSKDSYKQNRTIYTGRNLKGEKEQYLNIPEDVEHE